MEPKRSLRTAQREEETMAEGDKIAKLTRQEREIIALVCEGLKDRQIADRLSIKTETVRGHLHSIFSKLGASDRFELFILAHLYDVVLPPIEEEG
jgi:DNA-binding NarL/FixJ family response regulator